MSTNDQLSEIHGTLVQESELEQTKIHHAHSSSKKYTSLGVKEAGVRVRLAVLEPTSKKPDQPLSIELVKSTLDVLIQEDLVRCGGACHATVSRLTKKVAKRTGLRSNRELRRVIIQLLEEDSMATLWDLGYTEGEIGTNNRSQRIYALKADEISFAAFSKQTPREPSIQERVLDLFTDEVVLTPKAAAELLQMRRDRVNSTLAQLASSTDLVRMETGFYCLPGHEESAREKIDAMRNPISME